MAERQSPGALKAAIGDILKVAPGRGGIPGLRNAEERIRSAARLDYTAALKKHFDHRQLRKILAEVRRALPSLNYQVYRITEVGGLAKIAAELGVVLQAHAFRGADGTGLRGFYVNEAQVFKRPLIWVNTATHPTGVAAAFWHEIGHHLTNQMWGTEHHPVTLALGVDYRDNLADPKEVAADIVRVLAGYPKSTAQRLFGGHDMEALSQNADKLVARARPHVRAVMGFDFESTCSATENLYYLHGMIHNAKLRMTLLSEYDI
jgi:hypothetical protein